MHTKLQSGTMKVRNHLVNRDIGGRKMAKIDIKEV
jgi:hypothetical protein